MPDHYAHPEHHDGIQSQSGSPGVITGNRVDAISTETALAPILERRAAIDEQLEALQGQRDALDDVIRTIVAAEPGTYQAANGMTVQLRVNRRLDVKALERAYPAASCPQFYEPKLSTTKLRRHVAEVELEDLYVVGTPSVVTK